jgi:hypothetical protein
LVLVVSRGIFASPFVRYGNDLGAVGEVALVVPGVAVEGVRNSRSQVGTRTSRRKRKRPPGKGQAKVAHVLTESM